MKRALILTALLGACAALGACAQHLDGPQSPDFGLAVASFQSQIVPAVLSDEPPETSGARGVAAIRRLETGKTTAVQNPTTSSVSSTASMSTVKQ